jgi:hypothetical protein
VILARNARLKRAMDLSMKHEHLPKELQEKQTPFAHYLLVRAGAPGLAGWMFACALQRGAGPQLGQASALAPRGAAATRRGGSERRSASQLHAEAQGLLATIPG